MLTGCDQSIPDSVLIECSEVVHVALGWHLLGKHREYGNVLVVNFKLGQLHPASRLLAHHLYWP